MEKVLTISTKPFPAHEDGITMAVQNGYLFRNNPKLEELYREGYRINNYDTIADAHSTSTSTQPGDIRVYLVK